MMIQYVIYFSPKDYPDQYVIRKWFIGPGTVEADNVAFTYATLSEARAALPANLYRMERRIDDDPVIVEVWI